MRKTAFITGIAGQDGSYLSEYLVGLGYRVTGIVRRNSTVEHQRSRIEHLNLSELEYGDMMDQISLERALRKFEPDEIYNLAAQSHVRISSDIPQLTCQINAMGVLNLLEAYRTICPNAKFYQASSSEMFGNSIDADGFQRESTQMKPVSPYGIAKLFAYNMVKHYREAYGLHASNGILFNHESPRRGSNFVTSKVVNEAVKIDIGLPGNLVMGNLDSYRDWGHSYDYVRAMHLILQQPTAVDLVVATGESRSVRTLCAYVFGYFDLDYEKYVSQDEKFMRPKELQFLKGDSSKIRDLGWSPTYTFDSMMTEIIQHYILFYKEKYK